MANRMRWIVFILLCGGTVCQTTGCEALAPQLAGTLATTAISVFLNSILVGT